MGGADGRVDEDRMCAVQHVTNGGGLHHQVLHAGARELTLSPLPGMEGRVLLPSLAGRGWGGRSATCSAPRSLNQSCAAMTNLQPSPQPSPFQGEGAKTKKTHGWSVGFS